MKHTILHSIGSYQAKMDMHIEQAVEACCSDENINRVVAESVAMAMREIVNDQVRAYFTAGEGRRVIKAAVKECLRINLSREDYHSHGQEQDQG